MNFMLFYFSISDPLQLPWAGSMMKQNKKMLVTFPTSVSIHDFIPSSSMEWPQNLKAVNIYLRQGFNA